jgi:phosphotransferase system  glucose/maltose/N-acetylglucosamine-specific IIC component
MSKIDRMITESLSEDEDALENWQLPEPGYFSQAMALFTGKLGWVMWFVGIVQLLFFVGAVYGFVQLWGAGDPSEALRWAVITIVLVQLSTFLRGFMGSHFEANRVLRAVARLELRLAVSSDEKSARHGD